MNPKKKKKELKTITGIFSRDYKLLSSHVASFCIVPDSSRAVASVRLYIFINIILHFITFFSFPSQAQQFFYAYRRYWPAFSRGKGALVTILTDWKAPELIRQNPYQSSFSSKYDGSTGVGRRHRVVVVDLKSFIKAFKDDRPAKITETIMSCVDEYKKLFLEENRDHSMSVPLQQVTKVIECGLPQTFPTDGPIKGESRLIIEMSCFDLCRKLEHEQEVKIETNDITLGLKIVSNGMYPGYDKFVPDHAMITIPQEHKDTFICRNWGFAVQFNSFIDWLNSPRLAHFVEKCQAYVMPEENMRTSLQRQASLISLSGVVSKKPDIVFSSDEDSDDDRSKNVDNGPDSTAYRGQIHDNESPPETEDEQEEEEEEKDGNPQEESDGTSLEQDSSSSSSDDDRRSKKKKKKKKRSSSPSPKRGAKKKKMTRKDDGEEVTIIPATSAETRQLTGLSHSGGSKRKDRKSV